MEILVALFIFGQIPVTYADTIWTMYGGNAENTHFQKLVGAMETAPNVKWSYSTGGIVESYGAVVADVDGDGATEVIMGSCDKSLYCFDGATGVLEWQRSTGGKIFAAPAAADIDGNGTIEVISVSSCNFTTYCLNGTDGTIRWTHRATNYMYTSPAIADVDGDGTIDVVVRSLVAIYCLDGANGNVKWSSAKGDMDSSPAIADVDGDGNIEVVFGSNDNKLYCFAGATGTLKWSYLTGDNISSSPAIADMDKDGVIEIVFGSEDGKVYCLNGVTGGVEWSRLVGNAVRGSPAVADMDEDGVIEVILGSKDKIYCLNGATGGLEWSYDAGGSIIRGISVADIDGEISDECKLEVFIPNVTYDYLTCLNGEDGSVLWTKGGLMRDVHDITIADIDDDGCVELVLGTQNSHKIWAFDDVGNHNDCECGPHNVEENEKFKTNNLEFKAMGKGIYLFTPNAIQVDINVYDVSGKLQQTIYNGILSKGGHTFIPNIKSSGVYFVTIQSHNFKQSLKMIRF